MTWQIELCGDCENDSPTKPNLKRTQKCPLAHSALFFSGKLQNGFPDFIFPRALRSAMTPLFFHILCAILLNFVWNFLQGYAIL